MMRCRLSSDETQIYEAAAWIIDRSRWKRLDSFRLRHLGGKTMIVVVLSEKGPVNGSSEVR